MAREIRGWQIGEVVTANYMTLNSANMYEQTGSNGEANLPCIYNGLTLQSQSGTGNSIVTFNPGVGRCQDLPTSTYTYLPSNAYGTSYPCFIDISLLDSNTVITLTTSPTSGYIVATFTISPTTAGAVDYVITGSLLQIATGSYNPAIHVRLCSYNYTGSTFNLDFTPGTHRDTDLTGTGGVQWNYQNSSLVLNTPASQTGTSIVLGQPTTHQSTTTLQSTTVIQGANALQFYNTGNTHYTSLQAGTVTSNVGFILPIADAVSTNQFITSNMAGQLSFSTPTGTVPAATSTTAGSITREAVWTSYPATITGGGTTTNQSVYYKILGDSLFIRGYFTTGTVTNTGASCTIPSEFTISSSKLPVNNISTSAGSLLGNWENAQQASQVGSMLSASATSTSLVYFGGINSGGNGGINANGSAIWASTSNVSFYLEVPIV